MEQAVKLESMGDCFPLLPVSTCELNWRNQVSFPQHKLIPIPSLAFPLSLFNFPRSLVAAFCDYDKSQTPAPQVFVLDLALRGSDRDNGYFYPARGN